jgi:hypothetical protein
MHELPINKNKIVALAEKARHYNIFPIFMSHYLPESKVQQHPISQLLGELVEEALEFLLIATNEEIETLIDSFPHGIKMFVEYGTGLKEEQLRRIALYYIIVMVERIYFSFKDVINENTKSSSVLEIYPELKNFFDKDGLLNISDDFILHDGGIEYKKHMLHYHQLLRRGFTSNPNFDFTIRFLQYYQNTKPNNRFRVAIDHRRIMTKEFYSQIAEFDTWFGLSFNKAKIDDPNEVGLTVVKRNKNSLFELTNKLDRTEFFWFYRDGIKTFEVEEISDQDYCFDNYNFNRYIHSERDIGNKITRHLDGAVKVYLKDTYADRKNSNIPKEMKCYKKIKLWRIDGDIDFDSWINLISFFYKGNEMIIEYFNPEEFKQIFELRVRDSEAWERQQRRK